MDNNLYDILGVKSTDTFETIKKAYRKLSRTHHPDKGGDEEAFKTISQAWEILKDDNKRAYYDRTGERPKKPADINAAASQVIVRMFDQWLQSVEMQVRGAMFDNLINVDLVATIKSNLDATLVNAANQKGDLEKRLKKFGKLAKRCRGGFAAVVDSKIAAVNAQLDNEVNPGIEALNTALTMLDDGSWTYVFDEPKDIPAVGDGSMAAAYRSVVNDMGGWPTGGFFGDDN